MRLDRFVGADMEPSLEYLVILKYSLWLAIMFASCPTIVSEQVFEHHETVAESAKTSSFKQKLDRRVRFDTAGRTFVASVVELSRQRSALSRSVEIFLARRAYSLLETKT